MTRRAADLSARVARVPFVCILAMVPPSRFVPSVPLPAGLRRVPFSRVSHARPCVRFAPAHVSRAFRNGAFPVKHVFSTPNAAHRFPARGPEGRSGSLFAGGLNRSGEAWLLLSVRVARLSGALPIGVRRQALASVRGRRGGRQLHAWSSAVPECRSDKACSNATRRFGDKARDAHHRDPRPGEGHRWIATLRACHVPPVVDYRGCAAAPMPRDTPSPPRA